MGNFLSDKGTYMYVPKSDNEIINKMKNGAMGNMMTGGVM